MINIIPENYTHVGLWQSAKQLMVALYKVVFIHSLTASVYLGLEESDIIQIWGDKVERLQKRQFNWFAK